MLAFKLEDFLVAEYLIKTSGGNFHFQLNYPYSEGTRYSASAISTYTYVCKKIHCLCIQCCKSNYSSLECCSNLHRNDSYQCLYCIHLRLQCKRYIKKDVTLHNKTSECDQEL